MSMHMNNPRKNSWSTATFVNNKTATRLRHKKNKGVQQLHASSRNSEAIDVWKVARIPPEGVWWCACDDYSLKNTIVFILLQWDVQTIIKLKLKQTSKEYQKEFHRKKNMRKASQNVFSFILRFHKVCSDLKRL